MTETSSDYVSWQGDETRVYNDAEMLARSLYDARTDLARFQGWMTWKKNGGGREYLFRGQDRHGNGESLGPRTQESEITLETFREGKAAAQRREVSLREQVGMQAKFIRAVRLNRMPREAAKLLRFFERTPYEKALLVVGTHALYGYEAAAGVRFVPGLTATRDFDLLWDSKRSLELSADVPPDQRPGFLEILRNIDATFTVSTEHTFRVTSAQGMVVDFLMAEPDDGRRAKRNDPVRPIGLHGLSWLLTSLPLRRIAFSDDSYPIMLRVPQPSLFAAHKLWVAQQPDRAAAKRDRDRAQANAILSLLGDRLADADGVTKRMPLELRKVLQANRRRAAGR